MIEWLLPIGAGLLLVGVAIVVVWNLPELPPEEQWWHGTDEEEPK